LDGFTDFPRDTVHLFGEGNTYQLIDTTVGTTVFGREGRYVEQGSLLIFTAGGQSSTPSLSRTKDPGPYQLDLVSAGSAGPGVSR